MMSITVSPPNFARSYTQMTASSWRAPHIIHPRFELNEIVEMGSIFGRPIHVADDAAERKSSLGVAAGHLLERLQHPILIETAVPKVCFGVGPKFELAALLRRPPCRSPPPPTVADGRAVDPD